MTALIWLHDSAGVWLSDVRDESGMLISETAYMAGCNAPISAPLRIEGVISIGESLVTITPARWTVLEDVSV